jgi:hypothetical protein
VLRALCHHGGGLILIIVFEYVNTPGLKGAILVASTQFDREDWVESLVIVKECLLNVSVP